MYIRRKVFSILADEMGEERLYSVNETLLEDYEYEERDFADSEEEEEGAKKSHKKAKLRDVKSHKGIKRAIITAIPTGFGSITGGYSSKDAANKADDADLSDEEILRIAKNRGLLIGAGTAAGTAAIGALRTKDLNKAILGIPTLTALGAIGGYNAAKVNTKERLAKRALKERELNRDNEED